MTIPERRLLAIAAPGLSLAFLAAATAGAQSRAVSPTPPVKAVEAVQLETIAKDSKALVRYLKEHAAARDRLLADPSIRRALAVDPALAARLATSKDPKDMSPADLEKLLETPGATAVLLKEPEARRAANQELVGYQAHVASGRDMEAGGSSEKAVDMYRLAARDAAAVGNDKAEAFALLDGARALEAWERQQPEPGAQRSKDALASYDRVVKIGDERQRVQALNNKSVTLLRLQQPADAVASLRQVPLEAVPAEQRPVLQFNLARALEASGDAEAALSSYVEVVKARPQYRPAAEAVYRMLRRSSGSARVRQAMAVSDDLLAAEEDDVVREQLWTCVGEWAAEPDTPLLCARLLRALRESGFGPAQLAERESKNLATLRAVAPSYANFASGIDATLDASLPIRMPRGWTREVFPTWGGRPEVRDEWVRLLEHVAAAFDDAGDPKAALAHYLAAWDLDPESSDAVVYVAELLRQHGSLLEAHPDLVNQLVERVFSLKGDLYSVSTKDKDDWLNLLRYHVLLAAIFERGKRWGDAGNPYTALFQLEHALSAEAHVREHEPTFPPAPGLHYRLAKAHVAWAAELQEKGSLVEAQASKQQAAAEFLEAASGFKDLGNAREGKLAVQDVKDLGVELDERQGKRYFALDRTFEELQKLRDGSGPIPG